MEIRYIKVIVNHDLSHNLASAVTVDHLAAVAIISESKVYEWQGGQLNNYVGRIVEIVSEKKDYEQLCNVFKKYRAHIISIVDSASNDYDYNHWFKNGV